MKYLLFLFGLLLGQIVEAQTELVPWWRCQAEVSKLRIQVDSLIKELRWAQDIKRFMQPFERPHYYVFDTLKVHDKYQMDSHTEVMGPIFMQTFNGNYKNQKSYCYRMDKGGCDFTIYNYPKDTIPDTTRMLVPVISFSYADKVVKHPKKKIKK